MRRISYLALAVVSLLGSSSFAAEESLEYGRFGKLTLYRRSLVDAQCRRYSCSRSEEVDSSEK